MAFIVFVIAWLILVVIFISTRGESETSSLARFLAWLCLGVVVLTALDTMFTASFWASVGMIGSPHLFAGKKISKRMTYALQKETN